MPRGSWIRWPTHGQTHCIMLSPAQPDLSSINQSEGSGAVTNFNSSKMAIQTLDSRIIQLLTDEPRPLPITGVSVLGAQGDTPSSPTPG